MRNSLIFAAVFPAISACEPDPTDVQKCFEIYKTELLDPRSAYIVEERSYATPGTIKVVYRAKNAMGGYVAGQVECEADDRGRLAGLHKQMYDLDQTVSRAKKLSE